MIRTSNFDGVTQLKKDGLCSTINITESNMPEGLDFNIDGETKSVTFVSGDDTYILCDEFGIKDETVFDILLVKDGMLLKLIDGNEGLIYLYINNQLVSVDCDGNVDLVADSEKKKIAFYSRETVFSMLTSIVKAEFNLKYDIVAMKYLNHLYVTVLCENKRIDTSYTKRLKVMEYWYDFGFSEFQFVKYISYENYQKSKEKDAYGGNDEDYTDFDDDEDEDDDDDYANDED